MRLADVENPMVLEKVERTLPPRFTVIENDDDIDNPQYDVFGSFIASNDEYLVFGDDVIHIDNAAKYLEECLQANYKVKK